jgi:hypothetical protein
MTTIRKSIGSRRIPLHDHSDLNSGGKLRISSAITGGIETVQSVVPPRTSSGVSVSEEGADQGVASSLNFVGANVTAAVSAGAATITVSGGGGSVTFQDEGVAVGTATILNVTGAGATASYSGGTVTIDVAGTAALSSVIVQDEGATIGTASVLNFTGSGGTASFSGGTATIDITGGGGGISSGTAFPGSPATDDLFHRTDRDNLYFYDGTRWLSVQEFTVEWGWRAAQGPSGLNATTTMAQATVPVDDIYLTDLLTTCFVASASSGTQYWTLEITKRDAANAETSIGSVSTISNTSANWVQEVAALDHLVDGATYPIILLIATKVSTVGTLFFGVDLRYRLVG